MSFTMRIKQCFILKQKRDYVFLILLLLFAGFVWIGLNPFVGVYTPMTCDFLNFAKSMLDGQVLHRDIIDHKGLYTFVPYLFVCFLQRDGLLVYSVFTFLFGVFLTLFCYLYLSYFGVDFKKCCIVMFLFDFAVFILTPFLQPTPAFTPDNFMILVVLLLFWYVFSGKYTRISYFYYFLFGTLFGIILWSKYPLLVFFFPFYLYLAVYIFKQYRLREFVLFHLFCLFGLFVVSLPIFMYYGYHDCFGLMLDNYFFLVQPGLSKMRPYIFWGLSYLCLSVLGVFLKDEELQMTCLCMSMVFSCFLASGRLWTHYTLIILISLLPVLTAYYNQKAIPKFYILSYVMILVLGMISFSVYTYDFSCYYDDSKSFKYIADKYDIDNNDVMYLFLEDLGFGLWSPSGTYMNQWYPGRLVNTVKGKQLADVQVNAIRKGLPKYVATYPLNYFGYDTLDILDDNSYECVEIFRAYGIRMHDGNSYNGTDVYLYRRKD